MATPFLCANDTPFENLNNVTILSGQPPGIETLLEDSDLCNDVPFPMNGLNCAIPWQNSASLFQRYDYGRTEWPSPTFETDTSPRDREDSTLSDCSLDTFSSEPASYTWGAPQPEEPEPESIAFPRLSCRKCSRRFENAYSLEQHARVFGHRIFVCPVLGCEMSYTRRDSWTRHKRSHNLELRCDLCPEGDQKRTFKRKDHLLTHQRNCHPQACGIQESSSVSPPVQPFQTSSTCSCACSKGPVPLKQETRVTLEEIKEIKREHQHRGEVLDALEKRFNSGQTSNTEFASIIADLVTCPSQSVKPEPYSYGVAL